MQHSADIKFVSGMNEDVNPIDVKATGYYNGRNIEILDPSGSEFGNVVNSKGNRLLFNIPTIPANTELGTPEIANAKICGLKTVRDIIILFTTNNEECSPTASYGQIWVIPYNPLTQTTPGYILPHLKYNGVLNFSLYNKINSIEVNYKNDNEIIVYWADEYNLLRGANLMDANLASYSPDKFEMIPNAVLKEANVSNISSSGGNLPTGVIQYAYKLKNGSIESLYSPLSNLYTIYASAFGSVYSDEILGSNSGDASGKSCTVNIDLSSNDFYNEIDIYRITHLGYNDTPIVDLVYSSTISQSNFSFTDSGNTSFGNISYLELAAVNDSLFVPKWIAASDNRLFAANIKTKYFDVDYDARAYGFNISNNIALYYKYASDAAPTDAYQGTFPFPENADVVPFNRNLYKYRKNSTTLGGDGLNVSYEFITSTVTLDNTNNSILTSTTGNDDGTNPYNSINNRGYQRDEVYRFGIVFIDEKGNNSYVKYIADIKMPKIGDLHIAVPTAAGIDVNILGVKFFVNNVPVNPKTGQKYKYKIVRVERKELDRTIIDQGILNDTSYNQGSNVTQNVHFVKYRIENATGFGNNFWFKSPNTAYFKLADSIDYSGYKIRGVTKLVTTKQYIFTGTDDAYFSGPAVVNIVKQYQQNPYTYYNDSTHDAGIIDAEILEPNVEKIINGGTYWNRQPTLSTSEPTFYGGVSVAISCSDFYINGTTGNHESMVVNIIRDNASQYGGNTYIARSYNNYISTSETTDGNTSTINVYQGDVFITLFQSIIALSSFKYDAGLLSVAVVPLESQVNTNLDSSTKPLTYIKHYGQMVRASFQEGSGNFSYPDGTSYVQPYDAYVYNSSYSKENDVIPYIPKPYNYKEKANPEMIKYSEKNIPLSNDDNWKIWKTNNYQTVDSSAGDLTSIHNWLNNILFLQYKGFGVCKVNERITYQNANELSTVLGTGDTLGRAMYKSLTNGSIHGTSVITTNNSIMFYDALNRGIIMYQVSYTGSSSSNLSKISGINKTIYNDFNKEISISNKLLNHKCPSTGGFPLPGVNNNLHVGVNAIKINEDIYYSLFDIYYNNDISGQKIPIETQLEDTVKFSTTLKAFTTYLDFASPIYENIHGKLLSVNPSNLSSLWIHSKANRGQYYGEYKDSSITFLVNGGAAIDKLYTNIEYTLDTTNDSGEDIRTANFNLLNVWNEHQSTGDVTISNANTKRRMRKWHITIPRAKKVSVTDRNDVRIRSKYIFAKLTYQNQGNNKMSLNNISFKFNISEEDRRSLLGKK